MAEYCAWPTASFDASFMERAWIADSEPGPRNWISPMWLTSNNPTAVRTAMCSAVIPEYSTGISQPPKSTILAPRRRWTPLSAVLRRAAGETDPEGAEPAGADTMNSLMRNGLSHGSTEAAQVSPPSRAQACQGLGRVIPLSAARWPAGDESAVLRRPPARPKPGHRLPCRHRSGNQPSTVTDRPPPPALLWSRKHTPPCRPDGQAP